MQLSHFVEKYESDTSWGTVSSRGVRTVEKKVQEKIKKYEKWRKVGRDKEEIQHIEINTGNTETQKLEV